MVGKRPKDYVYAQYKGYTGKGEDWYVFAKSDKDYDKSTAINLNSTHVIIQNGVNPELTHSGREYVINYKKYFNEESQNSTSKEQEVVEKKPKEIKKISDEEDEEKELIRDFVKRDDVFKKNDSLTTVKTKKVSKNKDSDYKTRKDPRIAFDEMKGKREGDGGISSISENIVGGSSKIVRSSGEVKLDIKIDKKFLREWKNGLDIIFFDSPLKKTASIVFWKLVSDFTPFDEKRDEKLRKFVSTKTEKISKRKNGRMYDRKNPDMPRDFLQEERAKRGIYKGVKKSITQRYDRTKFSQVHNKYRYHLVDDVTIDSNGITWHAPYAAVHFRETNFNYNQAHQFNSIHATRGNNWTGRALESGLFIDMFYQSMEEIISTYQNDVRYGNKELYEVALDKGFGKYD